MDQSDLEESVPEGRSDGRRVGRTHQRKTLLELVIGGFRPPHEITFRPNVDETPKAARRRHNIAWGVSPRKPNPEPNPVSLHPGAAPTAVVYRSWGRARVEARWVVDDVVESWGSRPRLYYAAPIRGLTGLWNRLEELHQ